MAEAERVATSVAGETLGELHRRSLLRILRGGEWTAWSLVLDCLREVGTDRQGVAFMRLALREAIANGDIEHADSGPYFHVRLTEQGKRAHALLSVLEIEVALDTPSAGQRGAP